MVVGEEMTELLKFLIAHFAFLYEDFGAKIVDSRSDGPSAYLILETEGLRLQFLRDRGQIFLDFQGKNSQQTEWFSYDVIRQLLTGEVLDSAILDEKKAMFIKNNYQEIAKAFSKSNYTKTKKILHNHEKARAKRLFG